MLQRYVTIHQVGGSHFQKPIIVIAHQVSPHTAQRPPHTSCQLTCERVAWDRGRTIDRLGSGETMAGEGGEAATRSGEELQEAEPDWDRGVTGLKACGFRTTLPEVCEREKGRMTKREK